MTTRPASKIVLTFALALLAGCVASKTPIDPTTGIDQASGRIHVRADFIQDQADQIINAEIGTPVEVVKPHAETIKDQAGKIGIDQDEVDRLMAAERTAFNGTIKDLQGKLRDAEAKPFYLVKLFGSVGGLVMLVVGIYFAVSGKAWLNGGALTLAGGAALSVALMVQHTGWLIAILLVCGLAVIGGWIVIETIQRMKRAAVSLAEGNRKLQVANKLTIDKEAAELLDETQTDLAKAYVDVVTDRVKKAKVSK